jgi:predicted DNA-binding protein with PD1-like motif
LTGKGGHLFEAKVAAVGEFILRKINTEGVREFDPNIGLACMAFN